MAMAHHHCFVLLLFFLISSDKVQAARILGLFPFAGKSDTITYHSLTTELARRGHQVTVISPYTPDESPRGHHHHLITFSPEDMVGGGNMWDMKKNTPWMEMAGLFELGQISCQQLLAMPIVQTWLRDGDKFDLIITASFFTECTGAFAHQQNAHLIQICTFHGLNFMYEMMGNPQEYASVPDTLLAFMTPMSLWERGQNLIYGILWHVARVWWHMPKIDAIVREAFGPDVPSMLQVERNTSLLMINSDISQNFARALVPNVVLVGGMHIQEPRALPSDLKSWLDESKQGVVYFSMGSNLKSMHLAPEKREILLRTFGKLKERVLWKWESDSPLPGQPDNVHIGKWLPQRDLLAHPNIRLFITHGGLLSTQEAIYHAVPIIGIPIFGDQYINMNRMQKIGLGVQIDFDNLTETGLTEALRRVLSEDSFKRIAKGLSRQFRDQKETPLERAVFWTEYILRHNGGKHLRSAAVDLHWWQREMLDVLLIAFLLFSITLLFCKRLFSLIFFKRKTKTD